MNVASEINKVVNGAFTAHLQGYVKEHISKIYRHKDEKIVYVAGKVTGLSYADVVVKFNKRKAELIAAGYIVISPLDFIGADEDWNTAMAICLVLLPLCRYINLLHDWQDSAGANMEKEVADKLGITILNLK